MIEITNITKKYEKFVALEDVNLTIKDGSIFGLVGINGAGKTTLLRMLAGIYIPTSGKISYDGEPIKQNISLKSQVYFIPDEPYFTPLMKAKEVVALYKAMYPFDNDVFMRFINAFNLDLNGRIKAYSKGMRRRLYVAIGMAIKPKYFIVDEVFDGLDPQARLILKKGIIDLVAEKQTTFIIASHSLRELEDICDSYALLDEKKVSSSGSITDSLEELSKFQVAFNKEIIEAELPFKCLSFEASGRIARFVVRGKKEEIVKQIQTLNPLVVDEIPVNFEELFISNTNGELHL